MAKILALLVVAVIIGAAVLLGRSIKPNELENEVAPGVKPFVPSEQMAIFGTRFVKVEDILRQENPNAVPLEAVPNPEADRELAQGDAYSAAGQLEAAQRNYQKAVELLPGDVTALLRLADTEARIGQVKTALAHYLQVLQINPEIADAVAAVQHLRNVTNHAAE
ncbi:MAG: hypothetical protein M0Z55_12490 [Peptococcaceae bacterium]|nr:hypothetical protein [Peptococcaceae bacterium]